MILEGCVCNWDIPGVDELPAHQHYEHFEVGRGEPPIAAINVWVPWQQVARELTADLGDVRAIADELAGVLQYLTYAPLRDAYTNAEAEVALRRYEEARDA